MSRSLTPWIIVGSSIVLGAGLIAGAVIATAGPSSTATASAPSTVSVLDSLSPDDRDFCNAQADDPLAGLRHKVDDILADGGHWASPGEAYAFQAVYLTRAQGFADANIEDHELDARVTHLQNALFNVSLDVDPSNEFIVTQSVQELKDALGAVDSFCTGKG